MHFQAEHPQKVSIDSQKQEKHYLEGKRWP